jgi:nucleoside-diphosphate-sugar epimerase
LSPLSLYAETKVAVEQRLLAAEGGPDATVLRFATLFGIAPRMRLDLTVNHFAAELYVNRTLDVFGEQFWRPYVHVRDAARAVREVLEARAERVGGDVFNVGDTAENYQKETIVEIVQEELAERLDVRFVHVDEDPRDYRVSFDKIRDALGFTASRSVRDGVREVLHATASGVFGDIAAARYRNVA